MNPVYESVAYQRLTRRAVITLARPEKRNALNYILIRDLKQALAQAEADDEVKLIVLRAEGPVFCAGLDLHFLKQLQDYDYEAQLQDTNHLIELYEQCFKLRKVIVTVVEGDAFGAGAGLLAVSDIVLCSETARIAFNEVRFGQIPAPMLGFVTRKIGNGAARRLFLTGESITPEEALRMGLVSRVTKPEAVEDAIDELCSDLILKNSGGAMELTKRLLTDVQDLPLLEGLLFSARLNAHARLSTEARFAQDCFLEDQDFSW